MTASMVARYLSESRAHQTQYGSFTDYLTPEQVRTEIVQHRLRQVESSTKKIYASGAYGHRVPLIGMGGISNADDAYEFILAGATAVGVGTALFRNHRAPREIIDGLSAHLKNAAFLRLSEAVGAAHKNHHPTPV